VIPNGINLDVFAPRPRGCVRELLGIPREARVLLFVADDVGSNRKGFRLLVEALWRCREKVPDLLLLWLGQNKPEMEINIPWVHIGSVNNDRFLSMVYNAADLFAICSLQDNLPNTVLEAMACGVPVVGFAVGGITDMVRTGINGFTVDAGDVVSLANGIAELLSDSACRSTLGASARQIACDEYSLEVQANRYVEVYRSLI
jgi:glycosyltransferase involved in cell wall biosynthesis